MLSSLLNGGYGPQVNPGLPDYLRPKTSPPVYPAQPVMPGMLPGAVANKPNRPVYPTPTFAPTGSISPHGPDAFVLPQDRAKLNRDGDSKGPFGGGHPYAPAQGGGTPAAPASAAQGGGGIFDSIAKMFGGSNPLANVDPSMIQTLMAMFG